MANAGLPDPADVASGPGLAKAAKALMGHLGLSGVQVAGAARLSTGTVSELINGKTFPREDTFQEFVVAGCGQPWEPWRQAWVRAHKDGLRRRPVEDLAEDVEQVQQRVAELEAALTSRMRQFDDLLSELAETRKAREAEAEAELEQKRRTAVGRKFLQELDIPFLSVHRVSAEGEKESPMVSISVFEDFLAKVRTMATTDIVELHTFLSSSPCAFPHLVAGTGSDQSGLYEAEARDVARVVRVRVAEYLESVDGDPYRHSEQEASDSPLAADEVQ